jgi:hypothetical protein
LNGSRILRALAVVGPLALTGCGHTVANAPSAHAPAECATLAAELSRRGYTYNSKVAAIRAEIIASGMARPVCRDPRVMRQRIAELGAIVAIEDKMDAKGCYQRPIAAYDRNLVGRMTETLARCEAQAAANR